MGRKKWKHKGLSGPSLQVDADPTTRSIAVHGSWVAVAAGRRWRVVDVSSGAVVHEDATSHECAVRGLSFSPDGRYLLTCGDDKTARVWSTTDWSCVRKLKSVKKATTCTFSADGNHIFFADRFGDVLCATSSPAGPAAAEAAAAADGPAAEEAALLLGHLQSIVTSLTRCSSSSTGKQLLVSTDKDAKVRASVLPKDPVKGSYEIQSYCLGHTKFVTCSAAVPQQAGAGSQPQQQQQHLLLSGSGDGTIRLWDVDSGKELCCYVASERPPQQQQQPTQQADQQTAADAEAADQQQEQQQGGDDAGSSSSEDEQQEEPAPGNDSAHQRQQEEGGDEEEEDGSGGAGKAQQGRVIKSREACCAVLSLAVSPDGTIVAAAVESQQELQLLSLDAQAGQLVLQQKLRLPDVANPAALVFDDHGRLWAAGGVLLRETESAHVGVAAKAQGTGQFESVTAAVLPESVRQALEQRVPEEEEQQQQQEGYYFEGFKRAVYFAEEGADIPKRPRRAQRDIERLRALAAAQDQQQQGEQQQKQQQQPEPEVADKATC